MKPTTFAFLKELYQRFGLKSPKFFQKLQTIGIIATAVGFIPELLDFLDYSVPDSIADYWAKFLKIAGGTAWIISKLPVENAAKVVAGTDTMPFTAANNNPQANMDKIDPVDPVDNHLHN